MRYRRHVLLGVLLLALGGFGAIAGFRWSQQQPTEPSAAAESQRPASVVEVPEPADEAPPFSVSIDALITHDYDGRDFRVGRVLADEPAYTRYYITYESGGLTISGIMNVPKGDGPFPVLILNHGYIDPAVYTNGRGLKREQDYLAKQGFVVIHPDYRNHAESDQDEESEFSLRLGYTEDVLNAIYAVRGAGLPYIDGERIGMMGHSMGGGIAQNVMVAQPELVDAFVLYAPVSGDYRENFRRYTERREDVAQAIVERYGSIDENPEFWDRVSAASYYHRVRAPVQIHIGTNDESTPPEWSQEIHDRLVAKGKDVTLYIYEGEPHELINQWPLMMGRVASFFSTHL